MAERTARGFSGRRTGRFDLRTLPLLTLLALAASVALIGCKSKEVTPSEIAPFVGPIGAGLPEICLDEHDGKRFSLEGYLALPSSPSIDDQGHVDLTLYKSLDDDGEGKGRGATVTAKNGEHLDDLWAIAKKKKTSGYQMQKGELPKDALRIQTKSGPASARDKLRVVVELEAIKHFQTKKITACVARLISAEKL